MEDPDRPGDHACPHTLVTSIPDGIHKHEHTHNVNRWIEVKASQSQQAIGAAVTAAAAAAAVPIPFSSAAILVPIQLSMMARIAQLHGLGLDKAGLLAVASTSIATSAGRAAASSLLKFIPGAGSVVGGVINASVASGLTLAMGEAWLRVCQLYVAGALPTVDGKIDTKAVRELFEAELGKRLPHIRKDG